MAALTGCQDEEAETVVAAEVIRPVKLFTVPDSAETNLRRFPANVLASEEAVVSFRVPGEIVSFPVKPADAVEEGQLLARLDDRDFKTELMLRRTDYELALRDFDRVKKLREKQVLSQSDYDNAQARVKSAKAALKLAQDRLADTVLVAPFSGRIAQTAVENFQYIQPQQTILVLQDNNTLDISIQLPESILNQVDQTKVDQAYRPLVTFAGNETSYPVTYKQHTTQATPGTQAYEVVFSLDVPDDGQTIYPGMGATLHMDMHKILPHLVDEETYLLPVTAVLVNDATGTAQVWVYRDGAVTPVDVSKQGVSADGISVSGALQPGDQLVMAGLNQLRPGMKVKPLERERGL
ncbi:efflux RND transporter periplasmic adaptor subunit [Thaumasiovibrio subtropicus]|uniref:efflux RND transporter periplasmic adaptor subunit n=1 Tax=Thaumasiovibrio subtropicus TaxID=1891207 RepID=UPI00131DB3FE|nr:efflux RND transporter periplasmic adaptor subunit [Thaumasiovibrio subtropicus]